MYKFSLAGIQEILEINSFSKKKYPADAIYISATLEGVLIAFSVIRLMGDKAEILDVVSVKEAPDNIMLTVMKAAMNYVDLYGIKNVISQNTEISSLLDAAGFSKGETLRKLNLEGYFECGCSGQK